MKVEITTRYRSGVKDIAGTTIGKALHTIGFPEVEELWIGKLFELEYPDKLGIEYAHEMCKKELVNLVLFDYNIRIVDKFGEGMIKDVS